jgi:hypothetical protein
MSLQLRITSLIVLLLLPSCAARLVNSRDAKQTVIHTRRMPNAPLEEQVMACLKQDASSDFKVCRIHRLVRRPECGMCMIGYAPRSILTLGLWPFALPATHTAEVEGVSNGKRQFRLYHLFLEEWHGTLLWLYPPGRNDFKLAQALRGAIAEKRVFFTAEKPIFSDHHDE